jgi:flagellar hook-associated protein 3 FlgL
VRATFISTYTMWNLPRSNVLRMQSELAHLNQEISTGRMADVGLELGAGSAQAARLHIDVAAFDAVVKSNQLTSTRLEQTTAALDALTANANAFLEELVVARAANAPLAARASSALSVFISQANASDGNLYLFAGINSAVAPIADYDVAAKAAVDAAFLAKFGVSQSDPTVDQIDAVDMADFIDNEFADLFADPDWGTTWSSASDQVMRSRISTAQTLETSISANEPAMRKLAMVYTMVSELGIDGLAEDTRGAILDKAVGMLSEAFSGLTVLGMDIGVKQNRVNDATERLQIQQSIVEQRVAVLEGVDPLEAKVKLDTLTTQIEMSYSLTARLLRLSILNYA